MAFQREALCSHQWPICLCTWPAGNRRMKTWLFNVKLLKRQWRKMRRSSCDCTAGLIWVITWRSSQLSSTRWELCGIETTCFQVYILNNMPDPPPSIVQGFVHTSCAANLASSSVIDVYSKLWGHIDFGNKKEAFQGLLFTGCTKTDLYSKCQSFSSELVSENFIFILFF